MCDEHTERDNDELLKKNRLSRRDFSAMAGASGLALMLPRGAYAMDVKSSDVMVTTPDGEADCYFAHPAEGAHAGVLVWPDVLGLRPVFRAMGNRLASSGYAVLVVNPYYRGAKSPIVKEGESFGDPALRERIAPLRQALTPEANVVDAKAFVAFLDSQAAVDASRKIGTTGYCMGGPFTMRTAAALPERIGAGASFHGGGLATDDPSSPHLLVPKMQASYLFAIAANDDERDPEAKSKLRAAFDDAGLMAEIEVYEGANHGWCVPGSAAYNEALAERAWSRLLNLFEKALA